MPPEEENVSIANRLQPPRRFRWFALVLAVGLLLAGAGTWAGVYMLGKRPLPPSGGLYFISRVELPVPLFQQGGDTPWAHTPVGRSVHTIGQVGCAVASVSMIFKYYGIDTDPGRLNAFLLDHSGYTEDNDMIWEGPPQMAPTQVKHVYEDLPSYYLIDSNLRRGNPVIVRIRSPTA